MVNKLFIVIGGFFVLGVFGFALLFGVFNITGFAVFEQTGSDFDEGTYLNTEFNGSTVVLSSGQTSGTYTSKIFDAGIDANWNNLSWVGGLPEKINSIKALPKMAFVLDKPRASETQLTSAQINEINTSDNVRFSFQIDKNVKTAYLRINWTNNIGENSELKSVNLSLEHQVSNIEEFVSVKGQILDGSDYVDVCNFTLSTSDVIDNCNLYSIINTSEKFNNFNFRIFTEGISNKEPYSRIDFVELAATYAEKTNLSFQIRNCSLSDCSDGVWQTLNLSNLSLQGRYFQYKIFFESPDASISPSLKSITLDYTLLIYTAYVDKNFNESTEGWGVTHFDNINDALSAVTSGGTINVASGTYNERFTISKSVNLIGSGWETTTINGGGSGQVIVVNSNYVNISGFKIIGSGITGGSDTGLLLNSIGSGVISDNYFFGNRRGISLVGSPNNVIHSNYFVNQTEYGIYSNNWATQNNLIYNNYFSNPTNFYPASSPSNLAYFNITKTSGTNIVGGQYLGGNFWNNYAGSNRGDGFGDVAHNVQGNYYDYLPLVKNTAPLIEIFFPQNTDYTYNQKINLNYSVVDDDLETCWYVLNSDAPVILPNCENTSFYAPVGNHTLFVYANDTTSLIGSDNVSFNSVNTAPTINLIEPYNEMVYGYNESIALKFSVEDNEGDVESCWYNIDGRENVFILNCENTTFSVEGNKEYTLTIYVNDSLGEQDSASATFQVSLGAPTIIVSSPLNNKYLNQHQVEFIYTASDIDLDSCELWGDFTGTFKKNQTAKVVSGEENKFILNLPDRGYKWKIVCNDTEGNYASSPNRTLYVDTTSPQITITEPKGKKTSRTNIPLVFSVSDASPVTCVYNIYRGANLEIGNTSINCSETISFNVTVDADFVLNLYAIDLANNFNFASSLFSVDTSVTPQPPQNPSSGGSSGGGIGILIPSIGHLKIQPVNIILLPNEEKNLQISVKNEGKTTSNRCRIISNNAKYIESKDIKNIGIGEIVEFNFIIKAIDKKISELKLIVECLENVSAEIPLNIIFLENKLDVSIKEISIEKEELLIKYEIKTNLDSTEKVYFRIFDSSGNLVKEILEKVVLKTNQTYEGNVKIPLPKNTKGMLKVSITDDSKEEIFVEENFIYGGKVLLTGHMLRDNVKEFFFIGIMLIIFLVLIFLVIRRIWKLGRMSK